MKKVLTIKGMSCNHCVNHVKSALEDLSEVVSAEVILADEKAIVEFNTEIDDSKLIDLIDDEGYELVKIEKN